MIPPTMVPRSYHTSDGAVFEEFYEAQLHEAGISLKHVLLDWLDNEKAGVTPSDMLEILQAAADRDMEALRVLLVEVGVSLNDGTP